MFFIFLVQFFMSFPMELSELWKRDVLKSYKAFTIKNLEFYDFFTNRKSKNKKKLFLNSHRQITYSTKVSHYLDEKTQKAMETLYIRSKT